MLVACISEPLGKQPNRANLDPEQNNQVILMTCARSTQAIVGFVAQHQEHLGAGCIGYSSSHTDSPSSVYGGMRYRTAPRELPAGIPLDLGQIFRRSYRTRTVTIETLSRAKAACRRMCPEGRSPTMSFFTPPPFSLPCTERVRFSVGAMRRVLPHNALACFRE